MSRRKGRQRPPASRARRQPARTLPGMCGEKLRASSPVSHVSRADFRRTSVRNTAGSILFERSVLIGLDVVVFHHLAPGLHLIADEGAFDFRSPEGQRHLLGFNQLLGDALLAQGRGHLVTETLDDRFSVCRPARRCPTRHRLRNWGSRSRRQWAPVR